MEGEIKRREAIDFNDLITSAARELVSRYENNWVHKRVPGSDTELSSGELDRLLVLEKEGRISKDELRRLKSLRAELVEEADGIISGILERYPRTRKPTEMQRGQWIEQVLKKFQESVSI